MKIYLTNKQVILVYEEVFWEDHRDMFGLLNNTSVSDSLYQKDYATGRGRFYLFWNCTRTSGRPMLIALMAGDAAHDAENTDDASLIQAVTERLRKMFAPKVVPPPIETIVTRWKRDRFAQGSYSYVGPESMPGDYDAMAKNCGNLFFAGEATCGTHPATVHGAYLSGLRVASDVIDAFLGPISFSRSLISRQSQPILRQQSKGSSRQNSMHYSNDRESKEVGKKWSGHLAGTKHLREDDEIEDTKGPKPKDEEYEAGIIGAIFGEIGERPLKPRTPGKNPFLDFTKDYWDRCKEHCDAARRTATNNPNVKADRHEIRVAIGLMWRQASDDTKKPYLEAAQHAKDAYAQQLNEYEEKVALWDRQAIEIRRRYVSEHSEASGFNRRTALEVGSSRDTV
jgi:hypothetical protein